MDRPTFFTASTTRRIFAYMIDQLVISLLMLPVSLQMFFALSGDGVAEISIWLLVSCGLLVFFYQWLFLYFFGRTIGKFFLGLKLVSIHGNDLGFLQAGIRALSDQLSLFFSLAPRALAFFRIDRRQLSDLVAETQVVQDFPRLLVPARRWIFASFCVIYFSISGFLTLYKTIQSTEIANGYLIFYASR